MVKFCDDVYKRIDIVFEYLCCVLIQGGQFHRLNDPDPETIKMRIGVYYNYFVKLNDDENVVFTVPYNDSSGLGKRIQPFRPSAAIFLYYKNFPLQKLTSYTKHSISHPVSNTFSLCLSEPVLIIFGIQYRGYPVL